MGLITSRTKYRSDRGQVFEIDQMESSHLVNAIRHHLGQIDTLDTLIHKDYPDEMLNKRIADLQQTVHALAEELVKRDPTLDHTEEGDYEQHIHRDW